ncbi:MAG: UvrD-helicase domain-containing protein [Phycisphaerae bacterium]|nr:UvrD-helicase domain-containing protein [Phycisphaerae bacterium]
MSNHAFDQLTPSQQQAVCHKDGALLVLAGPGSGKTRVITFRIAALIESGVAPWQICAITFTNKAAQEMRQRAVSLGASGGAQISTFHSLCVRILRRYAGQAGIRESFTIYDPSDQKKCIKQAVKDCDLDTTNFAPAKMLHAISTLKNQLISAEAYEADAMDYFTRTLAQVYKRYQKIMADQSAMDFDDLLTKTAFLVENNEAVCKELANRYQYLLIDEYQDTNHAQYRMANAIALRHGNICATGDPDQSIYRWRGADIRNILAFETDWPEAKVVKLEENFRSTGAILKAADSLIENNTHRKKKRLKATKPEGKPIVVNGFEDAFQESRAVAEHISRLIKQGVPPNKIAVFYRVNAMSRGLEESFIRNQVPYQVVRGVEFYNRKEIKDLLAYLKAMVNPDDEIAWERIINTPARGIGKVTVDKIKAFARHRGMTFYDAMGLIEQIDTLSASPKGKIRGFYNLMESLKTDLDGSVAQLAERVVVETGMEADYKKMGEDGKDALDNLNELISATARYDEQSNEGSVLDYLQEISLFSDADAYDETIQRVALMTLHAAKGLEFEYVCIIGLEEGILPHERSIEDDNEMEEERRLFFVGITRAEKDLHISYAKYRTIRGQPLRSIPSKFLYEIGIGFTGLAPGQSKRSLASSEDAPAPAPVSEDAFKKGELVSHAKFGLGRVEKYVDMGASSVVTVSFNSGVSKNLMLKYAKLSKVK